MNFALLLPSCGLVFSMKRSQDIKQALLPIDSRWVHPHYLSFRPGDGQVCRVNPPRFSWGYVPNVLMDLSESVELDEFCLQLSKDIDFSSPDMEIRTPCNFYNALPVLEKTRWYWRVGYHLGTKERQWSPIRTFTFSNEAVEWDRTIIGEAAGKLASLKRPRFAPREGWSNWRENLADDSWEAEWVERVLQRAQGILEKPWWGDFPKSDRESESDYDEVGFGKIGFGLATVSFAWQLTGDKRFFKAKDHFLTLAQYPKGGRASPEFHGARRKWPIQLTEYFAIAID